MAEGETRPHGYIPRLVDPLVEKYLTLFGAVEVSGTRWCGKTWTSLAHANSVTYVDKGANFQITQADPNFALQGKKPHVIDEWQAVPETWDIVRHSVDEAHTKGRWILTGSSTPALDKVAHSGAGRIGRIRMHPMTLAESNSSTAQVSLAGLFEGEFSPAASTPDIEDLSELCCRGGWPGIGNASAADAQVIIREYVSSIFAQSIPRMEGSTDISRRLSESIARNLGQAATLATYARDVFAQGVGSAPSASEQQVVSHHLALLARSYLVDEVPGWVPQSRSPKRMRTKPKRYFADPSIACALLGLDANALMQNWQTFGLLFENLCMRDLMVYASVLPNVSSVPVRYYRDDSGLEADAVVEKSDGNWGAIEFKLSPTKVDEGAKTLLRLKSKLGRDELARTKPPAFLAVITGTGEAAYRRPDGVYVVPIRTLGA